MATVGASDMFVARLLHDLKEVIPALTGLHRD